MTEANRPADSVRIGNIEIAIWRNTNEGAPPFNFSLVRHYKDTDGNYKQSNSFSIDDLPVIEKVAAKALEKAFELQKGRAR